MNTLEELKNIKGFVDRTREQVASKPMFSRLDKDIPAGIVVFLVALPLCLGIALASGAPLISGLISGIIGGVVIGSISGSGTSVSGPAASVSAVVLVAIQDLGSFEVFLVALVIAGVIQVILGIAKAGLIADYMPTSIIKGLLAAIGLILIMSQLPYSIGLDFDKDRFFSYSEDYFGNAGEMLQLFLTSFTPGAIVISLISLFILLFWDKTPMRNFKLIPPALIVVILGVLLNLLFQYAIPMLYLDGIHLVRIPKIDSISSFLTFPEFSAIGNPKVWVAGLTIAIIASLSSLLNVEATDNIDPHKRSTPANRELVAQGIGNTLAGLIGGIAITSVIVRSSVNIAAGGETKLTTILHGFLLLLSVLFLSTVINLIPLSSLAAILLVVGYKLASISVFKKIFKKGWNQFLPFVVTIVAILLTDVLIGVLIGTALSVFFLLRSNYNNPFFIENTKLVQEDVIKLEFSNEVSFLNKAAIKKTLWSVPDNSQVIIDATFANFIDQDVIDILHDFKQTVAKEHDIDLSIIGLKEKYDLGDEIAFVDAKMEEVKRSSTPEEVLDYLREGNEQYTGGNLVSRRLRNKELSDFLNNSPLAVVQSCIDMREPLNMMMNTGIGDLIHIKTAGNFASDHVILSAETACREQGAKLILLMGNSGNALIKEALASLDADSASRLLPLVADALEAKVTDRQHIAADPIGATDLVTHFNLKHSANRMIRESSFISEQVRLGNVGVATAFFDRETGKVTFSDLWAIE